MVYLKAAATLATSSLELDIFGSSVLVSIFNYGTRPRALKVLTRTMFIHLNGTSESGDGDKKFGRDIPAEFAYIGEEPNSPTLHRTPLR